MRPSITILAFSGCLRDWRRRHTVGGRCQGGNEFLDRVQRWGPELSVVYGTLYWLSDEVLGAQYVPANLFSPPSLSPSDCML